MLRETQPEPYSQEQQISKLSNCNAYALLPQYVMSPATLPNNVVHIKMNAILTPLEDSSHESLQARTHHEGLATATVLRQAFDDVIIAAQRAAWSDVRWLAASDCQWKRANVAAANPFDRKRNQT